MKEIIEKLIVIGAFREGAFNFYEYLDDNPLINSKGDIIDVFKECNLARASKEGREVYKFLYNDPNGGVLLLSFLDHFIVNALDGFDGEGKVRPALSWTNGSGKSYITIGKNMTVQNLKFDNYSQSWQFEIDNDTNQTPTDKPDTLSETGSSQSLSKINDNLEQIPFSGDYDSYDLSL